MIWHLELVCRSAEACIKSLYLSMRISPRWDGAGVSSPRQTFGALNESKCSQEGAEWKKSWLYITVVRSTCQRISRSHSSLKLAFNAQ